MSGADCCGKTFLVILNIFVTVFGLLFLAFGLFLQFGLSEVLDKGMSLGPMNFLENQGNSTSALSPIISELMSTVEIVSYVFLAIGSFMSIVGLVGCCGACCSVWILLTMYAVAVLLVFVAKVIVLSMWLDKTVLEEKIFGDLEETVKTKYAGPIAFNKESLFLNGIMIALKCCGVDTYKEFLEAAAWNRTLEYTFNGQTYGLQQQIPLWCCKDMFNLQYDMIANPQALNCTLSPTSENSNIDMSCHEAIQNEIDANSTDIFGTYAVILALELVCIIVAIFLAVNARKAKKRNRTSKKGRQFDSRSRRRY